MRQKPRQRKWNGPQGTIYLLHLIPALGHAKHYLGWTEGPLIERLTKHRSGNGAKILAAQLKVDGSWILAATLKDVDRFDEWLLKQHGKSRWCPVCIINGG